VTSLSDDHSQRWLADALAALDLVGEAGAEHRARLSEQLSDEPVVAVVGAFSTGKSSLIKRLCAEHDVTPPEELVIDAAPTTTTTYDVVLDGVRWRDTPGLDSASVDHGRVADAAAAYADLVLITLTPELFSPGDELGRFAQALAQSPHVPHGAVHTVLTRADEQGGSRGGERFSRWADAKSNEARDLLASVGLSKMPVHVVAADARGRNAHNRPTADSYDMSREWDGITALDQAVRSAIATDGMRDAAVLRATTFALDRAMARAQRELAALDRSGDDVRLELERALTSLVELESRQRDALREYLRMAAADGSLRSLTARFRVAYEAWSAAAAKELEDLARRAGVEVDPWSGLAAVTDDDLQLDGALLDGDGDGSALEDLLREKAAQLAGSKGEAEKLNADLKAWADAKRKNKVRDHYEGTDGFSSLHDKREAERRLKEFRRRQAAFAIFEASADAYRSKKAEDTRRQAQEEDRKAARELAESKAVILARKLFDGVEVTGWKQHIIDARVQLEERAAQLEAVDARPALEQALGRLRAVRAEAPVGR